jgi:HAD superfamily hydrolase (TIGR01549 family)
MPAIDALCFDLFETLITERDSPKSSKADWAVRLGLSPDSFLAGWRRREHARMIGADPDFPSTLRAICRTLHHPIDEAVVQQLDDERRALKRYPFLRIDASIMTMLLAVRTLGLRIGVISNCTPEEVALWPTCEIAALVDVFVCSYAVGSAKPEPQIYLAACHQLAVQPARTCFIGDRSADELVGAQRIGMSVYQATWFLQRWPTWTADQLRSAFACVQHPEDVINQLGSDIR